MSNMMLENFLLKEKPMFDLKNLLKMSFLPDRQAEFYKVFIFMLKYYEGWKDVSPGL